MPYLDWGPIAQNEKGRVQKFYSQITQIDARVRSELERRLEAGGTLSQLSKELGIGEYIVGRIAKGATRVVDAGQYANLMKALGISAESQQELDNHTLASGLYLALLLRAIFQGKMQPYKATNSLVEQVRKYSGEVSSGWNQRPDNSVKDSARDLLYGRGGGYVPLPLVQKWERGLLESLDLNPEHVTSEHLRNALKGSDGTDLQSRLEALKGEYIYSPQNRYTVGQSIDHAKFGEGTVTSTREATIVWRGDLREATIISVQFEGEIRELVCGVPVTTVSKTE